MAIPRRRGDPPRDLSRPLSQIQVEIDGALDGERLDVALTHFLHWRSRTSILELIEEGLVELVGRRVRKSSRVRNGEVITIRIPERATPDEPVAPDGSGIEILYQDAKMIAVDKPAGLAVHPAGRRVHGTLIHWLHTKYRRPDDPAHDVVPRLLHRLDRETSGLVLASLDPDLHSEVGRQFEDREVSKVYRAVVHGAPPQDEGTVDLAIGPDRDSAVRLKLKACADGEGLPAQTHYKVEAANDRFSLVELRPKTGRTHQLRVHMAALGCPLVGDKIYGVEDAVFLEYLEGELSAATKERLILDRHALHNACITFVHPDERREMSLTAPLPADMRSLLE